MGGCQKYGLGPYSNTAPTQKGAIILTTTHMLLALAQTLGPAWFHNTWSIVGISK